MVKYYVPKNINAHEQPQLIAMAKKQSFGRLPLTLVHLFSLK